MNLPITGKLTVVPTPIGNLGDITLRALEVLKSVDLILAEDTRTSSKLLSHYEIKSAIKSFHIHNEHKAVASIIELLKSGKQLALVSDAGTPGISDPGFLLVRACHDHGIKVECLPGATALIPALVSSGLPAHNFHFEGFLPHKKGRQTRFKYLASLKETFLLYESPHRLVKCLSELAQYCGSERLACVCREISKLHEEIRRGNLKDLENHYTTHTNTVKGEVVIVVSGATD